MTCEKFVIGPRRVVEVEADLVSVTFLYHNIIEEGRANKVCLYFNDSTWTYDAVARMSNRMGNTLRELGVELSGAPRLNRSA